MKKLVENKNIKRTTKIIAYSAISTALVFLTTFFIKIPDFAGTGYLNLGDATIIVIAVLIGPIHALIAGAMGSMFADIAAGYAYYAPFTLVIKGLEGLFVGLIVYKVKCKYQDFLLNIDDSNYQELSLKKSKIFKKFIIHLILAEIVAFVLVVFLYFLAKSTIYSVGIKTLKNPKYPENLVRSAFIYAAGSIPGNLMQMSASFIVSFLLVIPLVKRIKSNKEI